MATTKNQNKRLMLDVIQSVIRDKHIPTDQNNMVEVKTNGRLGSMTCHIDCKDEEVLLCSFDERCNNSLQFPYFKEVHGMVSMCDYIVFVEDDNSLFVFLVDLKDSANSAKEQTCIAKTFAEFIVNRITEIFGAQSFYKPVQYRKIGVKSTNCKTTTKAYEKEAYDSDDYLVLLDYHHFYTRRLMDL